MAKLNEGMERGSLEHLVLPLISIDEFESKIDDRRVIVAGFYVKDQAPANDLSNFVEKSSIRPLDTEVSPAPTDDGFYMVFVEMGRNEDFPKRLVNLAEQLSNLTTTKTWKFKPYLSGSDEFFDLTEDNIREHINLDHNKVEVEDINLDAPVVSPDMEPTVSPEDEIEIYEHIGSFLQKSLIESVEIKGDWLRISERGNHRVYQIADWRKGAAPMPVFGLTIGNSTLRESNILQSMLGPAYHVECGDGHISITDGVHNLTLAVDS